MESKAQSHEADEDAFARPVARFGRKIPTVTGVRRRTGLPISAQAPEIAGWR